MYKCKQKLSKKKSISGKTPYYSRAKDVNWLVVIQQRARGRLGVEVSFTEAQAMKFRLALWFTTLSYKIVFDSIQNKAR
jgi:hypothetical protein